MYGQISTYFSTLNEIANMSRIIPKSFKIPETLTLDIREMKTEERSGPLSRYKQGNKFRTT